jgi:hypothetical protein
MPLFAAEHRIKFNKLYVLMLVWTIIAFLVTCYDYFILHSKFCLGVYPGYSFSKSVVLNLGGALFGSFFWRWIHDLLSQ